MVSSRNTNSAAAADHPIPSPATTTAATPNSSHSTPARSTATAASSATTNSSAVRRISVSLPQLFSSNASNVNLILTGLASELQVRGVPAPSMTTSSPSIHPQFRSKAVCKLFCNHCRELLCRRGMKAILLGNTKVELYSTDTPPTGVQLVFEDYTTPNCLCRIRDAACLGCGNVVGYHVTQPCGKCLESCNNGHFWMFQSDEVFPVERTASNKTLRWANVLCAPQDVDETVQSEPSICR
ncbi:Protein fam72a [Rhizoclosmatium hyalinum]|nr:Protein fam72a [Rhizoclosmatium hyalinum]